MGNMNNFQKLFVAIDFSPSSDEALRQAHERASSTGAQLAVCHIVPNELRSNVLFPHISRITALKFPLEIKHIAEAASARVTEITRRKEGEFELIVDDGTPHELIATQRLEESLKQFSTAGEALVTTGNAGTALIEVASERNADLIVVGTIGRTGLRRALLGSVAEAVAKGAPCSVLIVRLHPG